MIEEFCKIFLPQLALLAVIYALVLVMIALDLWSGVRKAKQRNECRSSYGYRETVKKIAQYYNALFAITVIDVIQMLAMWQFNQQAGHKLPVLPWLTFLGAILIGLIEVKSIYEKAEDKERARAAEAAAMLGKVIKDRDIQEIVRAVIEHEEQMPPHTPPSPFYDRTFQHNHSFDEE